ncbi:hypothetical protein F4824DRAFT_99626 [Ustulina deusta]|nr:hypothetical protein F4824DRAFT_99626 [Ustulina deusta]
MKFATPIAFLLHVASIVAAPTVLLQGDVPLGLATSPTANSGRIGDVNPESAAGPPSWRLDCGAPGTTSLCSASNSGAHCDPITGSLTITLEGTCGACRCVSIDQCTGRCS